MGALLAKKGEAKLSCHSEGGQLPLLPPSFPLQLVQTYYQDQAMIEKVLFSFQSFAGKLEML